MNPDSLQVVRRTIAIGYSIGTRAERLRNSAESVTLVSKLVPSWFVNDCFEADLTDGRVISAWLATLIKDAGSQTRQDLVPISLCLEICRIVIWISPALDLKVDPDISTIVFALEQISRDKL